MLDVQVFYVNKVLSCLHHLRPISWVSAAGTDGHGRECGSYAGALRFLDNVYPFPVRNQAKCDLTLKPAGKPAETKKQGLKKSDSCGDRVLDKFKVCMESFLGLHENGSVAFVAGAWQR